MRAAGRTRWRLALRDLAAAAAFASIAVSGSIPFWAIAAFAVGLVLSLLDHRLLAQRAALAAIALALAAVVLFGGALRGSLDLVVTACTFAALVTAHRMLSSPAPATDNQVHLTSLLMITGGAAISGELSFAPCLAAFTALSCLSLALLALERLPGESGEVPIGPLLRKVAVGTALAMIGGAAFFVVFPRLSWNVAARRTAPGLGPATAGFSDRVNLGGEGELELSPRVVFRAKIKPDPKVALLDAYWLGRTFDSFNGREWLGKGRPRPARETVSFGPAQGPLILQEIQLLPAYGSRTLVALEPAVRMGNALAQQQAAGGQVALVEVEGEEVHFARPAVGYSYQAYSLQPGAQVAEAAPLDLERYLSLPESLDPRVRELARRVVGEETDPWAAATALQQFLRREYRYTLELPGEMADPLASFLFERKKGHCEHFATALAVLLRAAGFPARLAAGFSGGERVVGEYIVRASDAHAWTQVYVPGSGFVSIDATPQIWRLQNRPTAWLRWLTLGYEQLDALWRARVIGYTLRDQADLAQMLVRPPGQVGKAHGPWTLGRSWLGAAIGGLVLYAVWRAGTLRQLRRRPHPAASFALDIERALSAARVERAEGEQLEELTLRLAGSRHPLSKALSRATRRYLEARFGGRPLADKEREALLAALRRAGQAERRSA